MRSAKALKLAAAKLFFQKQSTQIIPIKFNPFFPLYNAQNIVYKHSETSLIRNQVCVDNFVLISEFPSKRSKAKKEREM